MNRPASKDKALNAYIDGLELKLKKFTSNPYCDPYVTLKMIVDAGNKKIRALDIDFMADDAEKVMDSIEKWTKKQMSYSEQLEYFKSKMSPPEIKDIQKQMEENAGLAEKMALKNKK